VISKGRVNRRLRAGLNACSRKVFVLVSARKIQCKDCGARHQESIPIAADDKVRYTKQFRRSVEDLLQFATVQDVSKYTGMSWSTIKKIDKARLKRRSKQWSYRKLKYLAVDEIYIGKTKKYRTIVIDLETGNILFVGAGRGISGVSKYLKRVKRLSPNISAVAMDMSGAYHSAVTDLLPDVDVIFDRFHIIKLMNQRIDELRRNEQRRMESEEKRVLKGKRYLLLRNAENLTDKQRVSLDELLNANDQLYIAYVLKEDLRQLWECGNGAEGARFLDEWIDRAMDSEIPEMKRMAKTLMRYRTGVLNYFKHEIREKNEKPRRLTTGMLEGANNKIRTMTRKSYGLRDEEYLRLKLLNL
jgi:transposase